MINARWYKPVIALPPRRPAHDQTLTILVLLMALMALGQISTSIYTPSMPSLVGLFATSPATVNLSLSLFLFGFAVCQLVFGPLSDRYGRRPILFAGLILYCMASLICALAPTIEVLVVGRFLQGMAASVGPVLGRAIIRDMYGPDRSVSVMGYIGAGLAISPAISPMIGGYMQVWFGWQWVFVFLAIMGAGILITAWRTLVESRPQREQRILDAPSFLSTCKRLILDLAFWRYTLAVGFVFGGLMAFTAGAPFVFIEGFGLSPADFGVLYVFPVSGFFLGSLMAGRTSAAWGLDRMLRTGLILNIAGGFTMWVATVGGLSGSFAVLAPMALFCIGLGLTLATGMAGALKAFPHSAGAASALLGFVQIFIGSLASFAVGAMPSASAWPMATTILILSVAAMTAFTILPRR